MYKILLLLITFLFVSCWETNEQSVIDETGEIVEWYVDTLEWSVTDAKAVKDLMDKNNNKLLKEINNIK